MVAAEHEVEAAHVVRVAAEPAHQHLVAVVNKTAGTVTHYVNGVSQGSYAVAPGFADNLPIFLGSFAGGSFSSHDGFIDDVKIFSGLLTQAEITALAAAPAPEVAVFDGVVTDPQLTDNTGTQDFGTVNVGGSSVAQTFTIQNAGTADLTGIGGPPAGPDGLITGDDFNAFIAAFAGGCP